MRIIPDAGLDPLILRDVGLGLAQLAKVVELGDVYLSEDPTVPTATTAATPAGLEMRVNPAYFAAVTDLNPAWQIGDPIQPTKDAPTYIGMHEGLHEFFSFENPAFAEHAAKVRVGNTNTFEGWFYGANAVALNGGPVRIDQWGHLLGDAYLGDVMSGSYPTFRDRPQVLSAIDLAILKDVGAPLIVAAPPPSPPSIIALLYVADFGRAPDAAGLAYWQQQLAAGMPISAIAQAFFAQPEAQELFAKSANNPGSVVDAIFDHAFGHAPDAAGRAYWTHELESGDVTPGQFSLAIIGGAQGADLQQLWHGL